MDVSDKVCVITGANSGIGFETAKELARLGAFVVMVCRNEEKAEHAKALIERETVGAGIEIVLCDFSLQSDIHAAADIICKKFSQIDILINNHGFIAAKRKETIDGIEETFAVNHLGYFLFTNLLLDKLKAAENARVINVASNAHRNGRFNPDDVQLNSGFTPMKAYGNSKLFNILFTTELAARLAGTNVTANCLHPGVIRSNFAKTSSFPLRLFWKLAGPFMADPKQGAETTIFLATADEIGGVNGAYFINKKVSVPRKEARNKENAAMLWEISSRLCAI